MFKFSKMKKMCGKLAVFCAVLGTISGTNLEDFLINGLDGNPHFSLDMSKVVYEKKALFVPPLEEIAQVIQKGLREYFREVEVDVVDCPDLTLPPFTLACPGLSGDTGLLSVGGMQNFFPYANRSKVYDARDIVKILGRERTCIVGASAGPHLYAGRCCETIANINFENGKIDQQSRMITNIDGIHYLTKLPENETRFDMLVDMFVSSGQPGPVLKIVAKQRIGEQSFMVGVRKSLSKFYKGKVIGLGGVFVQHQGPASLTVVQDFSATPFVHFEDLLNWLRDLNLTAPLINVGTISTGKHGLDLRLQHFHTFSHHGDGGHYNIDMDPEVTEILAYFNVGEYVYRFDQPTTEVPKPLTMDKIFHK